MVVNRGEDIGFTLQLIKSDGQSFEESATVTYRIFDASGTVELVSQQSATFNSTTKSYVDTLDVSVLWSDQEVGSYLIIWSVSDTDDDFSPIYTEDLQISIDETKIDKILGLVHQNILIDNTTYDEFQNLETARVRIYSDSASLGTASNVIASYRITAVSYDVGRFTTWTQEEI